MLKTLLWCRRLQGTRVADGTHQTRTQSPSTFKLPPPPTVARYLIPQRQRIRCQVSVTRTWRLVSRRRLLQIACQPGASYRVKEMELPGLHTANWTCRWLWSNDWGEGGGIDHPTYLPGLAPSNFPPAWKAICNKNRRQASCHLSPPGYRHLTLSSSTLRHKNWCHGGT
jgi:hypothetical protein